MPLLLMLSLACRNKDTTVDTSPVDTGEPCESLAWYVDADGDGYGQGEVTMACEAPDGQSVQVDGDCDDADDQSYPGAPERCDGLDNDCDGSVDNGLIQTWFSDADGDGFGDPEASVEDCDPGSGYVADDRDCDDTQAEINPDAEEICDGQDNDCDGGVDEDVTTTYYADADGDGWGLSESSVQDCSVPTGYAEVGEDCDDSAGDVNPDAEEICDGIDNDCNGSIDEDSATDAATWYADGDSDGFGDGAVSVVSCETPSGYVDSDTDCDDAESAVNPDATELCDGVDNNCDGTVDEDSAADASTWYSDADSDGYGDAGSSQQACEAPSGTVSDDSDCDDSDAAVNTAATELCDSIDNDCDGDVDESDASDASTWYADSDGDSYGDASVTQQACSEPSGYVSDDTDCDDGDSASNPGASEVCDGADNDCDGDTDNGVLGTGAACPADDCAEILADDSTATDGSYTLSDGSGTYDAYCEMDDDGGGWTLAGTLVNDTLVSGSHSRAWNSYAVWSDTTTFGSISARQTTDYKGEAYNFATGDDLLIVTDEYAFAFYNVVGGVDFASFVASEYSSTTCSQSFLASGTDWQDGALSTTQAAAMSLVVRPLDDNATTCFPNGNENAIFGMQMGDCCWAPGLGNTPSGYPSWEVYDLSLLTLTHLNPQTCTAGDYPCNDGGYVFGRTGWVYTTANKVVWAEIYVR